VKVSFEGNEAFSGFDICTHFGKKVIRCAVSLAVITGGYHTCVLAVPHLHVFCSEFTNHKSSLSALIPSRAFLFLTPKHIWSPDALKGTWISSYLRLISMRYYQKKSGNLFQDFIKLHHMTHRSNELDARTNVPNSKPIHQSQANYVIYQGISDVLNRPKTQLRRPIPRNNPIS
jgi:hypothetical protein